MKTSDLIKLKESITQGEWRVSPSGILICTADESEPHVNICVIEDNGNDALAPMPNEVFPNAAAIALVPQLLSEVVTLRNALKGLLAIEDVRFWLPNNGLADGVELTDLTAARAALANDK